MAKKPAVEIEPGALAVIVSGIRNEVNRTHLLITTLPNSPDKQRMLEGLKASIDARCDRLDEIIGVDTQTKF